MTWAHAELDRKRMLEPLPLPPQYQDVARAFLPPFLPEDVELQDLTTETPLEDDEPDITRDNTLLSDTLDSEEKKELPQRLKRHLQNIYEFSPKPHTIRSTVRQWRLKRLEHKVQAIRAKRLSIYDELVALQALKKKAAKKRYSKTQTSTPPKNDLGYALVTGASRGIGRALAVELARWEIPLILVARDEDRLIQLATDIEQCYGVKCCILTADLSKPDAAFQIHRATTDAGLKVDILINNAGLSSSGEFVDMDDSKLHSILQVNTMSVAQLSRLYGSDMKNARRGRILIVSSVVGATYSGPTVAAYTATKAFEKVLGLSMAKELEVYGVGVTNLLPGAVADSSFRQGSGTVEALCWKLPGYPKTSEEVADHGVRALLGGDIEVIPGWHNRVFIKILHPILPQRAITLVMEAAWNPLSHWRLLHLRRNSRQREITTVGEERPPKNPTENLPILSWPGYSQRSPPRILKIEEDSRGDTGEEESEVPALLDASGEVSHSSKESESENTDSTKEYLGTEAGTEADEIVKGDPATKSEFSSREEMQAESGHVLRDHTIPPSGKSRHTDDVANPENEGVLYAI
jgi:short-subunit dehydrogenase